MSTVKKLRLGTRRSALAWIQSSQVAAALRAAHPGLEVELVGIDTRGDKVLDKPLSQMEGKEFFTAELDHALDEGRVEFTVHSLKDLSLERPRQFVLAAVPPRANPRDIALFAADVPARLAAGEKVRIGTSSPRRAELLPAFLARALPHASLDRIELVNLRGNVDSRLRRLHEPRGSERQLDGVVLAMAGLSRLYADTATERQGRALLEELFQGLHLMVLPLTDVPGAPGQGALAVECRANDAETRKLLGALEDQATRGAIAVERQLLAEHGGGCHQRFGAALQWLPDGGLLLTGGLNSSGVDIAGRHFMPNRPLPDLPAGARAWDGSQAASGSVVPVLDANGLAPLLRHRAVFLAHARALPPGGAAALEGRAVWTSGRSSWFALAAQGVWVQGCGEALGAELAVKLLAEPLLRLPPLSQWDVLTHADAVANWQDASWAGANVIATYRVATDEKLPDADALRSASHIFWSSTAQFERGRGLASPDAHHASGAGKTAEHIRSAGVRHFRAFPTAEEWRTWTAKAR